MTVYVVAQARGVDKDALTQYREHAPGALKKHGGALVKSSANLITLEGAENETDMLVLLSFPSEEAAQNWRYDEELSHVHDLRMKAANWSIQLLGA
ncbi:DUF1330 domain-containing protein [Terasakiella sp. A23]|uniref:DUF1330 domain-containing protein n=1 Tax=Terasakiella sp. FCG-A23 TaxID=3080561 RepID=UPI0029558ABB|nr:DUF1330 domain-containing protein [Terasakiella sp. A23]MDV7341118.1 DUF1330 domain-containing protein [Terasakiella sp. A23]